MKPYRGPPLGVAAAAGVRLIVWCKECRYQVEPDPAEMAARYGAETSVLDWRERLAGRYGRDRNQAVISENFEAASFDWGDWRGSRSCDLNSRPVCAITEH